MKKTKPILVFIFFFIFADCFAQTINVSDILVSNDQYIEIEYISEGRINILNQTSKEMFFRRDYKILIDNKGVVVMPNLLAALNFMYTLGYEVVLNYSNECRITNRYLMKKVVNNSKELLPSKL